MEFIYKFFKELNSYSNAFLFTLAISLGIFSGLNTLFVVNLIIFFIVLIFRIPFGLFLVTYGMFNVVGSFFDAAFDKIGYEILTSQSLNSFFTALYNTPFLRWSGFNNSVAMGSFFVGSVVFLLSLGFFYPVFRHYKKVVIPYLKEHKFFKFLVSTENRGIFRISGILAAVGVVVLSVLFVTFMLDSIIKFTLQKTLSTITKHKVEIVSFSTSIKNAEVKTEFLVNGYENNLSFILSPKYLVWKKFDFKELNLSVKANKKFKLPLKEAKTEKSVATSSTSLKIPSFKEYLKSYHLKSEEAYKKLKSDLEEFNKYKALLPKYKQQIASIKKEIKSINLKEIKPQDVPEVLKQLKTLEKRVKELKTEISKDEKNLLAYKKVIVEDIKNLKDAINEDYENIASRYDLLKQKEYTKFVGTFLRDDIASYVEKTKEVLAKIKEYMPEDENEITRAKGRVVKFKDKIDFPDFWVEVANVKVYLKNLKVYAKLKDINFIGKPIYLSAKILGAGFKDAELKAVFDKHFKYRLFVKDIKKNLGFIKNGEFNLRLRGEDNKFDAYMHFFNADIVLKDKNLQKILKNIHKFYIEFNSDGKINSDLDRLVSKELKKIINQKISKQKELLKEYLANKYKIDANLDYEKLDINSLEKMIEDYKKEALKKAKSKAKEELKNRAKELFKSYF